jgi:hypothetical protein
VTDLEMLTTMPGETATVGPAVVRQALLTATQPATEDDVRRICITAD